MQRNEAKNKLILWQNKWAEDCRRFSTILKHLKTASDDINIFHLINIRYKYTTCGVF